MMGLAVALAGAASVAAMAAARPAALELGAAPTTTVFPSATRAIAEVLASAPGGVAAFGELHQTTATVGVPSALRRFTADVLPALAGRLSHLVVETWVTNGRCGEAERTVTTDVKRTTMRPASTESEIEALIRTAGEHGVAPRILSISCADYQAMRAPGGVDYDRTLRVTARALEAAIIGALSASASAPMIAAARPEGPPRFVAVYGGALHNDLLPVPELAPYSFAPRVLAATLGRYLEIDLVVPEYARASAPIRAEAWWRAYERARRPDATVLIQRAPRSYVVVFPAQPRRAAGPADRRSRR